MKSWKTALIGTVAIIAFGFAFIACGGDDGNGKDEEQPEFREDTISFIFSYAAWGYDDRTGEAKVQGTFTKSQWDDIVDKIETAINGAYNNGNLPLKDIISTLFAPEGVTIIVGNRPTNKTYETVGDSITLYLNIDAINKSDFQQKITDAVLSMNDSGTEIN
jgi:hypothetical protein